MPFQDDRHRRAYIWATEQAVLKGYPAGREPRWLIDQLMQTWLASHPPAVTQSEIRV